MRSILRRASAAILLATGAAASAGPPSAPSPAPPSAPRTAPAAATSLEDAWRGTTWGMAVDEVLAALPAGAFRVSPEVRLPDGNVVAAGLDGLAFESLAFNVRFVFEAGKLTLVSLRTPQNAYADAAAYEKVRATLVARWGEPLETTKDDALIDMRQTRWERGASRTDLKYIPGVLAIVHYPSPAPPVPASAPPPPAATGSAPAAKP